MISLNRIDEESGVSYRTYKEITLQLWNMAFLIQA